MALEKRTYIEALVFTFGPDGTPRTAQSVSRVVVLEDGVIIANQEAAAVVYHVDERAAALFPPLVAELDRSQREHAAEIALQVELAAQQRARDIAAETAHYAERKATREAAQAAAAEAEAATAAPEVLNAADVAANGEPAAEPAAS